LHLASGNRGCRFFSAMRELCLGTALPSISAPRAYGVPSIYQPGKALAQSESQCFVGFYAVFLESQETEVMAGFYILCVVWIEIQVIVVKQGGSCSYFKNGN
jgi:hypothetical protein